MNPIEQLLRATRARFPHARYDLDPAQTPSGSWFLDVRSGHYALNVEWHPQRGFGVTAGHDVAYGEGADERYEDVGQAARRVLWLLESGSPTQPPLSAHLRRLRTSRHVTQEDLASRLGVKQAAVSKFESRGETVTVRKLQEFVAALGGQLTLRVSFEDGSVTDLPLERLKTGTYD